MNLEDLSYTKLRRIESEKFFRKSVIIPLFKDLHAENVQETHGSTEVGIDIYFEWFDIFSHRRRFGIQAKIGNLVCRSRPDKNKNIKTICNQIRAAFSKQINLQDSGYGKIQTHIDGYYIIISGKVNENAQNYILQERKAFPFVHLIEGEELIRIIQNRHRTKRVGRDFI